MSRRDPKKVSRQRAVIDTTGMDKEMKELWAGDQAAHGTPLQQGTPAVEKIKTFFGIGKKKKK